MRVEKEVLVKAPVDAVYRRWTDFENFPSFMKHVESVTRTGDDTYHWKAMLGGRPVEWDAKVIGLVPNRSVTWRSTSGAENAGAVTLTEQGDQTLMRVVIEYHASWFAGLLASVSGEMARSVEADLDRFKELAESASPAGTGSAANSAASSATATTSGAGAQGTTSENTGSGNAGAMGPSSTRSGQTPGGPAASSSAPPPDWARSGQMQGGHEGGGEYATGGASSGSLGGTSRSGSFGPASPVPGEEMPADSAASSAGAAGPPPGNAEAASSPAPDETAGTDRPIDAERGTPGLVGGTGGWGSATGSTPDPVS